MRKRSFLPVLVFLLVVFIPAAIIAVGQTEAESQASLRYWDFINPQGDNPRSDALRLIIEDFEAKNPNIDLAVEVIPWNKIAERLIAAVQAKNAPDVARVLWNELPTLVSAGTLVPLDPYTGKWSAEQRADSIIPYERTVFDGKKMAVFLDNRTRVLYYRKDIYAQYGYSAAPDSLQELADAALKITQATSGEIMGYIPPISTERIGQNYAQWFVPTLIGEGGAFLHEDGTAAFNSKAGARVLMWVRDLIKSQEPYLRIEVAGWGGDDEDGAFKAGTQAAMFQGTQRVVATRSAKGIGDNLVTTPLPSFKPGVPSPALVFGWLLGITPDCKNPDAAWTFIEHMISPETQITYAKVAGEMPSRKSAAKDAYFTSPEAAEKNMWTQYMQKHGIIVDFGENWKVFSLGLANATQEIIVKGASPEQVLEDLKETYNTQAR